MKKLASIILALLVIGISPVVSLAGELEDAQEQVRLNPNDGVAHFDLGVAYGELDKDQDAIASYKEAIRINTDYADAHTMLGNVYEKIGKHQDAISSYKESIRINPNNASEHNKLGEIYEKLGSYDNAIAEYEEALRIDPVRMFPNFNLHELKKKITQASPSSQITQLIDRLGEFPEIQSEMLPAPAQRTILPLPVLPMEGTFVPVPAEERLALEQLLLEEERKKLEVQQNRNEADRLAHERKLLEEERRRLETHRLAEKNRQQQPSVQRSKEQSPQSGTGSGFFVSKMGHVITNAHVVRGCKRITIGDNANKQVPAEVINTDKSNDLALLKLSSLEMASAESKSLIQKLSIVVVPLASKGLLRSDDVRLGEKVLVAGYPYGDIFSNTIKVTGGLVSATRGAGDDTGQFQLDAAVQPGNSGGPIYDSSGNIVGVVVAQLDKLKMAKAIGSLPENVNFGIKASTVRQFLMSSGLPSKKAEQTEEKSTEQLAEIAQNQALMVMCLQ